MILLLILALLIIAIGITLLFWITVKQQKLGIVTGKRLYQDTRITPGKTLYATTVNLIGKPDFVISQGDHLIPVEVKTGKTPKIPYKNHVMQLLAYCLLVEENYGVRPIKGYVRYPEQEFAIEYTDDAKQQLIRCIAEITEYKITKKEPNCSHPSHNM